MSDKTEEPTPRRLTRAIDEGDVPVSAALVSGCAFVAAGLALPALAGALLGRASALLRAALERPPEAVAAEALSALGVLSAPVLLSAALAAALVAGVQARGAFAPGRLAPDLSRLAGGLASLASGQRLLALGRGLATALLVALLCRNRLRELLPSLAASAGEPGRAAALAAGAAGRLVRDVGFLLLASAVVDLALTVRSWRNRLRMSPDEVKREAKESEGDPQLKAARERAHHELLTQASIHAVKDASVLVVNPTHLATALRYRDGEDDAPTVLAKGEGPLAAQLIEAARAYNVPIVHDIPLARALHELEVGEQIPEALYEAVAEVLRSLWEAAEKAEKLANHPERHLGEQHPALVLPQRIHRLDHLRVGHTAARRQRHVALVGVVGAGILELAGARLHLAPVDDAIARRHGESAAAGLAARADAEGPRLERHPLARHQRRQPQRGVLGLTCARPRG